MAQIESFRDLETWQVAMTLALECFAATKPFPPQERFGLAQQIRKSAVSIPSNIAEGFNRRSKPAYINHVCIALGSQAELDTQLEIGARAGLILEARWKEIQGLVDSTGRLLHGLVRGLEGR